MQKQSDIQLPRRSLVTGAPFYLPVAVPFTATANETVTVYTKPALTVGDLEIIGATTDLQSARGKFSINKRPIWSDDDIPLATLFGKPDGPKPVIFFPRPLPLLQGQRIRADLVNTGGEAAGTMVFICRQVNLPAPLQQALPNLQDVGEMHVEPVDSQFTATSNEVTRTPTAVVDYDYIIRAFHTTLAAATIRIIGLGGLAWMEDPVPVWAIAGNAASTLPNQPLQPPVLIPADYQISFEFTNAGTEASGHLYTVGQRTPRQRPASANA